MAQKTLIKSNVSLNDSTGRSKTSIVFQLKAHTENAEATGECPVDYVAHISEAAFLAGKDRIWIEDTDGAKIENLTYDFVVGTDTLEKSAVLTRIIEKLAELTGKQVSDFELIQVTLP